MSEHTRSRERAAPAPLVTVTGGGRGRAARIAASPHAHKFLAATIALTGLAAGAIAVAIVILVSGSPPQNSIQWSPWSPPDSGLAGEREIADEVAPLYRASPSQQLVLVTVHNASSNGTGSQIALRDPNNGSLSLIAGNSAVYTMCGLGPDCAIATGTPSSARLLLLRREALELSLYTFRYVSGIDNVVSILPPGYTQPTAKLTRTPPAAGSTASASKVDIAIVFQRANLTHFLQQPLTTIFPENLPPTVSEMANAPEAELVSVLTSQALFRQQLIQTQDGSSVLVLDPLPPQ